MGQAALFSGQGAQHVGMGRSYLAASDEMRVCFSQAGELLGLDLQKLCCEGPLEELTRTEVCQPALFTVGYGIFLTLERRGFWSDLRVCLGQSLGEWTALAAAGAISFAHGLSAVAWRARCMQAACDAGGGAMAALVGGDREKIFQLCEATGTVVSNYNAPDQLVLSGSEAAIAAALERVGECSVRRAIPLAVAGAYHSPAMEPARQNFIAALESLPIARPRIPVLSNVTGRAMEDPEEIRRLLAEQIVRPVRWEDCLRTAEKLGATHFYECGAGRVLVGLARKTLPGAWAGDVNDYPEPRLDSRAQR
ncbi:MAG: ACP S-malonyltransferase [Puniceicoccales bacterium]|jgi:[acyl-carrier-protein] S-malonyltransferase|nr:ACP S-malonyltransferase [Puniceicoccales bacterium]